MIYDEAVELAAKALMDSHQWSGLAAHAQAVGCDIARTDATTVLDAVHYHELLKVVAAAEQVQPQPASVAVLRIALDELRRVRNG